jgi:hypothetical protein
MQNLPFRLYAEFALWPDSKNCTLARRKNLHSGSQRAKSALLGSAKIAPQVSAEIARDSINYLINNLLRGFIQRI